ncbi:MAG: D-2-hydroxyacid dehydrogenase [Deltaproteobacteria bacterium]|nr:D-2-hydroxyacid dehydrogenase [Deltaproteobacteria bacterium]
MKERKIGTLVIPHGISINPVTLNEQTLMRIRQAAPEAELVIIKNKEEWEQRADELISKTEVVFGRLPFARIGELPNLRWIQQDFAGSDWLQNFPDLIKKDFILTNASGVHAIPIAEHILAMMLALARDFPYSFRKKGKHQWGRRGRVIELDGATLGVIGLGKIGEKTAEKAKGLNMKVLAIRRNPERSSPYVDQMYGKEGLYDLLSQSDWVVIAAPMTPETKGMIGERELKSMKKSAHLINIARGSIIQESVLIKALQEGWIAGAGLDVFEKEPLPPDSPLWDMENVIITGHFAGSTPFYFERVLEIFLENLRRYRFGEPLINVVDKWRGY